MLDHLSEGRLEVGVGRGVSPIELGFFGVEAETSADIAAEALAVIKLGISNERLNHQGRYFQFDDASYPFSRAMFFSSLQQRNILLGLPQWGVKEWKGSVIFMHEVAKGTADRSYGIHVGKLAGLPNPVLKRSKEILNHLEGHAINLNLNDLFK